MSDALTLTQVSPADKPWIVHKAASREVSSIYAEEAAHLRKAERMHICSGVLEFGEEMNGETGEVRFRLLRARFCRVRYCPVCQWRRALLWRAKFYQALPVILSEHPKARFLFLTLTVKNCDVGDLRATLKKMNDAWAKLIKRKEFSCVLGWVRTTEITREDPKAYGNKQHAHPHFHCLLMVTPSYFSGQEYVSQDGWRDAWKGALKADYDPQVRITAIKSKNREDSAASVPHDGITETLKYSVKHEDMTADPEWFVKMTEQTHRLRFIATGGLFKNVLKPEDKITDEDMVHIGEEPAKMELVRRIMRFLWKDTASDYFMEWTRLPIGDEGKRYSK